MPDLMKYALLAVGAYWLYAEMTSKTAAKSPLPQGASPGAPAGSTGTPGQPPPASAQTQAALATVKQNVAAAAAAMRQGPLLTFDQWNYFFARVTGHGGPAIEDVLPNADRDHLMTIDQWSAAALAQYAS